MKILLENIGKPEQDNFLKTITQNNAIWCTEKNLGIILQDLFEGYDIIHDKMLKVNDRKFRPDYYIPELKLTIEFLGPKHFTDFNTIVRDETKKQMYKEHLEIDTVEVPYFIQLTPDVCSVLFSKYFEPNYTFKNYSNDFPHGFIHPSCVGIADFVLNGILRFDTMLNTMPDNVIDMVHKSSVLRIGDFEYNMYRNAIMTYT